MNKRNILIASGIISSVTTLLGLSGFYSQAISLGLLGIALFFIAIAFPRE